MLPHDLRTQHHGRVSCQILSPYLLLKKLPSETEERSEDESSPGPPKNLINQNRVPILQHVSPTTVPWSRATYPVLEAYAAVMPN